MCSLVKSTTTLRIDEVMIRGDIHTPGARLMGLQIVDNAISEYNEKLSIFPGAEVFGEQNSKYYQSGDWSLRAYVINTHSSIKAVVDVSFTG